MRSFYEKDYNERFMFLNSNKSRDFWLSSITHNLNFKTQFTQKEIDEIKEEQHTDLSEFKQIPVEEVEAWTY